MISLVVGDVEVIVECSLYPSRRIPFSGSIIRITTMNALARVSVDCGFPLVSSVISQSVENLSLSQGTAVLASFKASAVHVIR